MKQIALFFCCHLWVAALSAQTPPFEVADEAAFFNALDLDKPGLSDVRVAVGRADWTGAKKAWARHLETRRDPSWIWSRNDRERIESVYRKSFGGLKRFVPAADKVLARDFNLLGVRRQLTPKVEWLQGPTEWTHVLSRFAYWDDLGKAWWATGDAKYPEDFVRLMLDWVESNPVPATVSNERGPRGSVWRTLEAGIRAQSWFGAMEFFMDAPAFDAEAKYRMSRSLIEHARYLHAWTTKYRGGNWQVCEASGLATVGIMLPECREAAAWRERGLASLTEHLRKDVGDDGMHWELTPSYHTWVMLELMHASQLCTINRIESPLPMDRHQRMFEALMKLMRPDGSFPPVGDAGIGDRMCDESLGLGALLYQRPDLRFFGPAAPEEKWLWLLGHASLDDYPTMEKRAPDFTSILLPDAKYAVMRSGWKSDDMWLMFDAAPWRGGHSHQDRLQVTLFKGRDLIKDAGMISYDQPDSKALRKSAAHNVLLIDDGEQIAVDPVFETWHTSRDLDFATASVEGGGFRHRRSVLFVKSGYAVVFDTVFGNGSHGITRLFQLPPGAVELRDRAVTTRFPTGMNIRVETIDDAALEMREGTVAKSMTGVAVNPVAAFVSRKTLPATFITALMPHTAGTASPRVRMTPGGKPDECRLLVESADGTRDAIVIGPEERELQCAGHKARALVLLVRRTADKETGMILPVRR